MTIFRRHFEPRATGCQHSPVAAAAVPAAAVPSAWSRPPRCPLSHYFTPVKDQGQRPTCVAFSLASVAEAITWRKTSIAQDYDEEALYASVNGGPGGILPNMGLLGAIRTKILDPETTLLRLESFDDAIYGVHKYGALLAVNKIDEAFDQCTGVLGVGTKTRGFHMTVITGYDLEPRTTVSFFGRTNPKPPPHLEERNSWGSTWGADGYAMIPEATFAARFMQVYALVKSGRGLA